MGVACSRRGRRVVVDSTVVVRRWSSLVSSYIATLAHIAHAQRVFALAGAVLRRRPRSLLDSATQARSRNLV